MPAAAPAPLQLKAAAQFPCPPRRSLLLHLLRCTLKRAVGSPVRSREAAATAPVPPRIRSTANSSDRRGVHCRAGSPAHVEAPQTPPSSASEASAVAAPSASPGSAHERCAAGGGKRRHHPTGLASFPTSATEPMAKRPSASICQTKRSGWRRSLAAISVAGAWEGGKAGWVVPAFASAGGASFVRASDGEADGAATADASLADDGGVCGASTCAGAGAAVDASSVGGVRSASRCEGAGAVAAASRADGGSDGASTCNGAGAAASASGAGRGSTALQRATEPAPQRALARWLLRGLFRWNFACPRSKHQHQDGRSIAAQALDGDRSVGRRAAGAAVDERGGGDGVDAEGRQRCRADKARERRLGRIKKRALAGEGRKGTPAIGKQPAHALAQRQRRPRRLGGDDQDGRCAVGENEARANTGKRASEVAPNPRRRSSRGWPDVGRVAARRTISAAVASLAPNRRSWHSPASAAPKIAAPTAFAQMMRDPSVLQSHAGAGPVAWAVSFAASCGSRNGANADSTSGMRRNSFA